MNELLILIGAAFMALGVAMHANLAGYLFFIVGLRSVLLLAALHSGRSFLGLPCAPLTRGRAEPARRGPCVFSGELAVRYPGSKLSTAAP